MAMSEDVQTLFRRFGGNAAVYKEIVSADEVSQAKQQWPILKNFNLDEKQDVSFVQKTSGAEVVSSVHERDSSALSGVQLVAQDSNPQILRPAVVEQHKKASGVSLKPHVEEAVHFELDTNKDFSVNNEEVVKPAPSINPISSSKVTDAVVPNREMSSPSFGSASSKVDYKDNNKAGNFFNSFTSGRRRGFEIRDSTQESLQTIFARIADAVEDNAVNQSSNSESTKRLIKW